MKHRKAIEDSWVIAQVICKLSTSKGLIKGTLDPANPNTKEILDGIDYALDILLGKEDKLSVESAGQILDYTLNSIKKL
jgi:hypothetical protein